MNHKEIRELIDFLIEKDIAEFELERADTRIRVRRGAQPVVHQMPDSRYMATMPAHSPAAESAAATTGAGPHSGAKEKEKPAAAKSGGHTVKSPIVGTFYESPSPGSPPFVKAGDQVEAGQVLCIVEAMKLMNEIEADVAGTIVERLVNNGQPIEYGQELFTIQPRT